MRRVALAELGWKQDVGLYDAVTVYVPTPSRGSRMLATPLPRICWVTDAPLTLTVTEPVGWRREPVALTRTWATTVDPCRAVLGLSRRAVVVTMAAG
jgi:hypothetical protein